ncbi:MAG: hypothetical protein ACOY4H_06795 [Thermodesulfobacteriota bacterium]
MFFKNSRYRKEPSTMIVEADGRRSRAVRLRRTPTTNGTFLHTIADGERLDHLAVRYYREPRAWWRLADAAAGFSSPLDLLGLSARLQVRIVLTHDDEAGPAPWNVLATRLSGLIGVEDFLFSEEVLLDEGTLAAAGATVPVAGQSFRRSVLVSYNRLTLGEEALMAAIATSGFTAAAAEPVGRIGKQIVIPPASGG